jgi:hypothetical protein
MLTLELDASARLQIAQALIDNEAITIVTLPDGKRLRVLCHFGHIAVESIPEEKDLFGKVGAQVAEVLHG